MPLDRRRFLAAASLASPALLSPRTLFAAAPSSLASDPLRPQFHLMPPRGWMNDPNGPLFWRGQTHLFFQVNPTGGADWGDISWAHAVSPDMFHWRLLPNVMEPASTHSPVSAPPNAPDSYGVFSGSALPDGNRALFFYTGVALSDRAHATIADVKPLREQQCVAVSSGPDLLRFTRQPAPLIAAPPASMQPTAGFRDPTVWRDGSAWYMILGSGVVDREGAVLLYRASIPDGPHADWTYLKPLFTSPGNGKHTPDTVDAGTMLECPDFFPLDGHHVLLYSTERKVFWVTGHFDPAALTFTPQRRGLLDSGAYYAPKSMAGPAGQRILWGWIPERRPKPDYIAAGWAGCMALPRVLHVDVDGSLTSEVARGIDALCGPARTCTPTATLSGTAARLDLKLVPGGSLAVTMGRAEVLRLSTTSAGTLAINGEPADTPAAGPITAFLDASVIELFAGPRFAQTLRVYPTLAANASTTATLSGPGSRATLRPIRSISPNRMT